MPQNASFLFCLFCCLCAYDHVNKRGSCDHKYAKRNELASQSGMGSNRRCGSIERGCCVTVTLTRAQQSVRPDITPATLAMPTSTMANLICPECGTNKKSGRLSCCARGGAWFKQCGDAGESQFAHTWTQGIQACRGLSSSVKFVPCVSVDIV